MASITGRKAGLHGITRESNGTIKRKRKGPSRALTNEPYIGRMNLDLPEAARVTRFFNMDAPSDARTRPENQSRDWDAQTVGDSDPATRIASQEKSIHQLENPPSAPDPTRPTSKKEASTAGSFSALALANTSSRSPSRMEKYHAQHFLAGTPGATLSVIGSLQNAVRPTSLLLIHPTDISMLRLANDDSGLCVWQVRRQIMFIAAGCIVVFVGQLLAAFCTSLWSIFLTQGVLQGVGCGLLLPMIFALPSQWFSKRRGVATGFVIAGSSFGAAVPALIVQGLTMLLGFLLVKVRPSVSGPNKPAREIQWLDKRYLADPTFWSCWTALFFALFRPTLSGYMCPFVFISVYTGEKIPAISSRLANLPIPIMSFASAIGRIGAGHVADRIGFMNAFILAITISGLSQLVLWNVAAETYAGIMVFS
ncbi:Major Facilitator Superfamily [Rhizoctonia solani]|uniref:Major Facilitator Superfamily n=1 Tax=Rhizoctonia solani TaxID=456999 RepID=A0A8H7I847_9AGAM|nr:Major Facilitator Superfamily [Rhizoctonia solani]